MGLLSIVLVLAGASVAFAGAAAGADDGCGLVAEQNDARSGRDAGESPDEAVVLEREGSYSAALSAAPQGPALDAEDWYQGTLDDDTERDVYLNASLTGREVYLPTSAGPGLGVLAVHAYAPGSDTPTHTAYSDATGVVRLHFVTDAPGTWDFSVELTEADGSDTCPADGASGATVQTYDFYLGCRPHCLELGPPPLQ